MADTELWQYTPLLVGLSTVPDVRQVLGVIHQDHVVNFQLAIDMTRQLQPDLYGSVDHSMKEEGSP